MGQNDVVVTLERYTDEYEAAIAKGLLETNGVHAEVTKDYFAELINFAATPAPYAVVVLGRDVELARQILDSYPIHAEGTTEHDDDQD